MERDQTAQQIQYTHRQRNAVAVVLTLCLAVITCWLLGIGGLSKLWPKETLQPVCYLAPGGSANSSRLLVAFPWKGHEFCEGDLEASVTETATEVLVHPSERILPPLGRVGPCFGRGVEGGVVRISVDLSRNLGSRRVIRSVDGLELPKG